MEHMESFLHELIQNNNRTMMAAFKKALQQHGGNTPQKTPRRAKLLTPKKMLRRSPRLSPKPSSVKPYSSVKKVRKRLRTPETPSPSSSPDGAQLKRRLSDEMRQRCHRTPKSSDDRLLRSALGNRLKQHDEVLMSSKFHDKSGRLDKDKFEDFCRPIIAEVLQETPEDPAEPDLVYKSFQLCLLCMKARKWYLKKKPTAKTPTGKKESSTTKASKKESSTTKATKKPVTTKAAKKTTTTKKATKKPATTKAAKKTSVATKVPIDCTQDDNSGDDSSDEESDSGGDLKTELEKVDDLFVVAYECWDCNKPLQNLQDCFPQEDRHKVLLLLFYCFIVLLFYHYSLLFIITACRTR